MRVQIIGASGGGKSLFTAAIIVQWRGHHKHAARIPAAAQARMWQKGDAIRRKL